MNASMLKGIDEAPKAPSDDSIKLEAADGSTELGKPVSLSFASCSDGDINLYANDELLGFFSASGYLKLFRSNGRFEKLGLQVDSETDKLLVK